MLIDPRFGVFWRTPSHIQIGLDPRVAVTFDGLTSREQEFVAFLTSHRTHAEIDALAWRLRLPRSRCDDIIEELREHRLLLDESQRGMPLNVRLMNLDPLAVSIAYALARAGLRRIYYADARPITPADHPALVQRRCDAPTRDAAFALLMETTSTDAVRVEPNPENQNVHAPVDLTIVTGSRAIDPLATTFLMEDRAPHLLVWMEDVDMCIGPLVEPYASACARCLYNDRLARDPAWRVLFPQVLAAPSLLPSPHMLHLVGELVARSVLSVAQTRSNVLFNRQWRIPLRTGLPYMQAVDPHPRCGCLASTPAQFDDAPHHPPT